jgi:dihydropteroate synthase
MTSAGSVSHVSRFGARAASWRLRTRRLDFTHRPLLMGIVNCTPDSFSDGGQFFAPQAAIDHARRLLDEGADIIDIGGESTRPYSTPVDADEELRRVMPVVEALCGGNGAGGGTVAVHGDLRSGEWHGRETAPQRSETVPQRSELGATGSASAALPIVSIDTSKARVAREAVAAGCEIINDVTALAGDAEMLFVARDLRCGVCAMHMQGTPQTMQDNPTYTNVVADIFAWLRGRRDALVSAGIDRERIALDPGIGFGKTHQHNLTLAANCWRLHELGQPLLVGHSRKGIIGKLLGDASKDRTFGTLGVSLSLAGQGVQILRVHDVAATREALLLYEATGGIDGQEKRL